MWWFKRNENTVEGEETLVALAEEAKKIFSMTSKIFGKLGFPVNILRATDSTNISSKNTNISQIIEGHAARVDYSHVANSAIAAPAPVTKILEEKKTQSFSRRIEGSRKGVTGRGRIPRR